MKQDLGFKNELNKANGSYQVYDLLRTPIGNKKKFKNAKITAAGLEKALKVYGNEINGRFYNRTYNEIVESFSELSMPLRAALATSWMTGQFKPNLDNNNYIPLEYAVAQNIFLLLQLVYLYLR